MSGRLHSKRPKTVTNPGLSDRHKPLRCWPPEFSICLAIEAVGLVRQMLGADAVMRADKPGVDIAEQALNTAPAVCAFN
jgi:hypothetical protein